MKTPFRVGFCLYCGKQAQVRDSQGKPIRGLSGSKLCNIILSNDDSTLQTRIGNFPICSECDVDKISLNDLKTNLISTRTSGITGLEYEWSVLPKMAIEVIKTYA